MASLDSLHDFVLFPGHESYSDMLTQGQLQTEADFNSQQFNMNSHLAGQYSSMSFDPFASSATFSQSMYQPSNIFSNNPRDSQNQYRTGGSPAPSVSQSFEHPPSIHSSASGPSVPSASSSTIGSPFSSASHGLSGLEAWKDAPVTLGPSIVHSDNFVQDTFMPAGLEHELIFPRDKIPNTFVGECAQVPSSTSALSSSLSSNASSLFSSGPHLAVNTTPQSMSRASIDTILDPERQSLTPHSATSPSAFQQRGPWTPPKKDDQVFKSPVTPASATHLSVQPASWSQRARESRRPSVDSISPWPTPSEKPLDVSSTRQMSPFFSQSSGNYVAPLESSCRFPSYHASKDKNHLLSSLLRSRTATGRPHTNGMTVTDPSLIQPFHQPQTAHSAIHGGEAQNFVASHAALFQPPSPAPSDSSSHSRRAGSATIKTGSQSPSYLHNMAFQPYPTFNDRRQSISSIHSRFSSHSSPQSGSFDFDEETKEKGRCPDPKCGKIFKDLKAHMLTHQPERPEKCPIVTCDYHQKGFARKYDKNRHTLTHYKGTMVCGFCAGPGTPNEKSFNRADVFKRHLTSVHGVEQTPPNSRKKPSTGSPSNKKLSGYAPDATGKCSTCSGTFSNAQDFYEHLDDCVLRIVQQEDPTEAINAKRLAELDDDADVEETMKAHNLSTSQDWSAQMGLDDEEEDDLDEIEDDLNNDDPYGSADRRAKSGKGAIKPSTASNGKINPRTGVVGGSAISKLSRAAGGRARGMTFSKGGVALLGKGRKKRKNFPVSWGCSADKMKMKKRVLCVYDGSRRLWKDDMMLDNEFEVRLKLGDGKNYITDLDVETMKRAEAFHNATEEERGPWVQGLPDVSLEGLMK